ncbi:MAG: putative Holliday junction resolvase [Candidatus Saccharibacteria bacterium]|nr:putative Holliday junction resolvase [Candidatus Saccharibacteria bacterium]
MANLIALDVGTRRIGVAAADSTVPVAMPLVTVDVDGDEVSVIKKIIDERHIETVVVGYPRNQSGEATDQTAVSETLGSKIAEFTEVVYQDESLTSIMAEDRLKASGKPYSKADIDAFAAMIILQDYLEDKYAS